MGAGAAAGVAHAESIIERLAKKRESVRFIKLLLEIRDLKFEI